MNRMLSMSSDVNDPGARSVTFDQVYAAYREQALALHEGGVDLFLIETITDTLNAKAAIKAILDLQDEGHEALPIWISGTITDRSGRTLSGQTVEAFWNSVKHARPFAIGLNCALGCAELECGRTSPNWPASPTPSSRPTPTPACPTPSANTTRPPNRPAACSDEWADSGIVNILGGCCGTTPGPHPPGRRGRWRGLGRRALFPSARKPYDWPGLEPLRVGPPPPPSSDGPGRSSV